MNQYLDTNLDQESYEFEDTFNESYIFSEKNIEIDVDKWSKKAGKNILFITGLSGSGKSTLAKKISKEKDALYIELDNLFDLPDVLKEKKKDPSSYKLLYEFINKEAPELLKIAEGINENNREKWELEFDKKTYTEMYIRWLIKELSNDINNLHIIEGAQLYQKRPYDEDLLKEIIKWPLIIVRTSMSKSIYNRIKREVEIEGKGAILPMLIHSLKNIKANIDSEKELGEFKNEVIKESYEDDLDWIESFLMEDVEEPPSLDIEEEQSTEEPSFPKQTDSEESDKNGIRRKKLYIAFIEWCKAYNNKNTFGSVFDKDVFHVTYPFVPEEMRYFYRLANPMLCVLAGSLAFFALAELKQVNAKNSRLQEMMIFAATKEDLRIFNLKDKKIYRAVDEKGYIQLKEILGETFDLYIQNMIKQGNILTASLDERCDIFVETRLHNYN